MVRTVHFGGSERPDRMGGAPSTSAPAGRAGGGDGASIKAVVYRTPPVARAGRPVVGRYLTQRPVWSESGTTLVIWSLKKGNRLIGPDPWIRLNSYRSLSDQIQIRSIPDFL